jgi:hypothetical protein
MYLRISVALDIVVIEGADGFAARRVLRHGGKDVSTSKAYDLRMTRAPSIQQGNHHSVSSFKACSGLT